MKADGIALLFDRTAIEEAHAMAREIEKSAPTPHNAGWSAGVQLFEATDTMQYLVMVADGSERVIGCAPRVALAADQETLQAVLAHADEVVIGRTVKWIFKGTKETDALVRQTLRDLGCIHLTPSRSVN